jgi:hypothetical protein
MLSTLSRLLGQLSVAFAGVLIFATPAEAVLVSGAKKVVVLRVYFHDYTNTSRYTQSQVQGFFSSINTLWGTHSSYGTISINSEVNNALIQLPDNRSTYIDDHPDGDTSDGGKYMKVLKDAIANSTGLNWTNVDAVMIVMSETDSSQFHRGQGNRCNVPMGPGSSSTPLVGCAIFSENPSDSDPKVWGRWAHELGHAFQAGGPAHPSDYNSNFEQMDADYPGQTGVFEKQTSVAFGWLPDTKYQIVTAASGGRQVPLYAEEYDPTGRPNIQAVKAFLGTGGSAYYLISVRRRVLGDDLNDRFSPNGIPDEGVLIERVDPSGAPQVTLQGKGGDRDKLWHEGDLFSNASDGIFIAVDKKFDADDYDVTVRYADQANKADVGVNSWLSPPANTYESTDIWVDSPVNGYGTFRYGTWSDLMGGAVPKGNGDDPAIGQINRIYARVRNYGTATASNVVVHFDVTDPLGLGINGSNGFKELGTVDSTTFPALASIPGGGTADVYLDWTPNATLTPAQIAAGTFYFHTCLRIRLDHLANETIFGNQDGSGQQENVDYFQAPASPGAPSGGAPNTTIVHLRNDSMTDKKYFNLGYDFKTVPSGWKVTVNAGQMGMELLPDERRDIPVSITPTTSMPAGSVASVKLFATSFHLLTSDKDPNDKHPEYKELGGVVVEGHAVIKTRIKCVAVRRGSSVQFVGQLILPKNGKYEPNPNSPLTVMLAGAAAGRKKGELTFLPREVGHATVQPTGRFRGVIERGEFKVAACMFAGTETLSSAIAAPVPVK